MKDIVFERFKSRIEDLGLEIDKVDEDGLIHIVHDEGELKISLDNVRKSYEQEGNFDHLDGLIESIHKHITEEFIPSWDEAHLNVYQSLFPADYDWDDFIYEKVTDEFYKNYIYYNNGQYIWINQSQLKDWQIDEAVFKKQVEYNMNTLLDESTVEITETEEGLPMAFFDCPIEGLKSALLFSTDLKKKIEPIVGWPIFCVLPVRDFCYMFNEKNEILIEQLGSVVLDEYQTSAYPVTTEILKISNEGIKAIGKYENTEGE